MRRTFTRPSAVVLGAMLLIGCQPSRKGIRPSAPENGEPPLAKQQPSNLESTSATGSPVVEMDTSSGRIVIELNPAKAPKTVANFLRYVDERHYDGTIYHRVIPGFMIQGGGFRETMEQKPTRAPIPNEADNGLKNDRGTIAMARTSEPHSAGAQFFINLKDNDFLNFRDQTTSGYGYCVFGKVVEGMDVVDKIAGVKTQRRGPFDDVPTEIVLIQTVRRK